MNIEELSNFNRVIIIDNNKEDGVAIQNALKEKNISSLFICAGDRDSLPRKPFSNVRLVFLDLELILTSNDVSKASMAIRWLSSVIKENSFYVLVIWSGHIGSPLQLEFMSLLNNRFNAIHPCISPIALTKASCKKRNGDYSCNKITQQVKKGFKKISNYDLFIRWENIVEDSISEFLSDILSNENQRKLSEKVHALANAYAGKKYREDISKSALLTITDALKGLIDININKEDFIKNNRKIYKKVSVLDNNKVAVLNTKLFLNPDNSIGVGCVLDSPSSKQYTGNLLKKKSADCIDIAVNITPICDIAQGKNAFNYYVHGLLALETDIVRKAGYIYEFKNIFRYKNKNYKIVLNLKALETVKKTSAEFEKRETLTGEQIKVKVQKNPLELRNNILIKLKDSIVIDFQHRIAAYNSRPGHVLL